MYERPQTVVIIKEQSSTLTVTQHVLNPKGISKSTKEARISMTGIQQISNLTDKKLRCQICSLLADKWVIR
jgi:hypothetical protein